MLAEDAALRSIDGERKKSGRFFAVGKFMQKLEVDGAPKWVLSTVITNYGTLLP